MINTITKSLIEHYIEYIESENFTDFYDLLWADPELDRFERIGEITQILLDTGIDPVSKLSHIPVGCYCNLLFDNYIVDSHIKEIQRYAFSNCLDLKYVYIPDSVKLIDEGAFSFCNSLDLVVIENPAIEIAFNTFYEATIKKIKYAGTRIEWEQHDLGYYKKIEEIECSDGVIKYV